MTTRQSFVTLCSLHTGPYRFPGALTTFSRQIAEKEAERKKMKYRLAQVGSGASQGKEQLGHAVRKAYRRAVEQVAQIASPAHLNRFVEDYIGPMTLTSEGLVIPRSLEMTTASDNSEAVVNS